MIRFARLAPALLLAGLAVPAAAQTEPPSPAAMAGTWLLVPEDGGKGCSLTLEEGPTIGGFAVTGSEACGGAAKAVRNAFAWDMEPEGSLIIKDIGAQTLLRLFPAETGRWTSDNPPGEVMVLVRAGRGVERIPTAREVAGTWQMKRPGGPAICTVTFEETPPAGAEGGNAVTFAPGCDAGVQKLKLATWKLDGALLVLGGSEGASLSFQPKGAGFAKAEKEGGKPLDLVRVKK